MEGLVAAAVFSTLVESTRHTGVAVLLDVPRRGRTDAQTHEMRLYQFIESGGATWVNFETVLSQTRPEIVYIADTLSESEWGKAKDACESAGAPCERAPRSAFSEADIAANLVKLTGAPVEAADTLKFAAKAAACLISKGRLLQVLTQPLTSGEEGEGAAAAGGPRLRVVARSLDSYLRIDAAVEHALNLVFSDSERAARGAAIMAGASAAAAPGGMEADRAAGAAAGRAGVLAAVGPGPGGYHDPAFGVLPPAAAAGANASTRGGVCTTVLELLSAACKTRGGKRLLRSWLLQPLVDPDHIRRRQAAVNAFLTSTPLRTCWKDSVSVPDLDALSRRLNKKGSSDVAAILTDLVRVYHFAVWLPQMTTALRAPVEELAADEAAGLQSTLVTCLQQLEVAAAELGGYRDMCVTLLQDPGSTREPRIKPEFDPALGELAVRIDALEADVMAHWDAGTRGWGADIGDIKCEKDSQRGYVFRAKKTAMRAVEAVPGVRVTQVLKDGVYFQTSTLRRVSEELLEVEGAYRDKARGLAQQALDTAKTYTGLLEHCSSLLSELDAYYSMAAAAGLAPTPYCRPEILPMGAGKLEVRAGRHPLLERQDGVDYIPNDYGFTSDGTRFTVITGPNMGGKSTYIRTLGVIAVMAQMGSFVPAEAATLPVLDSICARVGAGDITSKGISTFMAEMLEASSILATATSNSLVIIDELGRGTSTYDGFGLAWAISEYLADTTRCFTLFATHFHELAALSQTLTSVNNRHVTAHTTTDTITMLYSVREGACPTSFGIHVAEMAAFPPAVIAAGRLKAAELEATSGGAAALMFGAANAEAGGGTDAAVKAKARRFATLLATDASFAGLEPAAKRARLSALVTEAAATTA